MNKILYRVLASIFGLFSLGAMSETYRIMTSSDPDIASERIYLAIMSFTFMIGLLLATRYYWNKSKK